MSNNFAPSTPSSAPTNTAAARTATGSAVLEPSSAVERIHADHTGIKRLGNWTTADRFELRVRSGNVTLDLRSPELPADIDITVEMDRAMVKLLLPDGAILEHWDLAWTGRGKVKDSQSPSIAPTQAGQTAEHGGVGDITDTTAVATAEPTAAPTPTAGAGVRRVRLNGNARTSEVRVNRGGVAILAAMCSKEYIGDLRHAHKAGVYPTVDDPTRAVMSFR